MSKKLSYWLWSFLLIFTVMMVTQYFQEGMMGLIVFALAYLTKGMRRSKFKSDISLAELEIKKSSDGKQRQTDYQSEFSENF